MSDLRPILPADIRRAIEANSTRRSTADRKMKLLEYAAQADTVEQALDRTGIPKATFSNWLSDDKDFARAWRTARGPRKNKTDDRIILDLDREFPDPGGLVDFRKEVFGFPSTETQQAYAKAYDDGGNYYIFWLAPAGAGKDVTAMQSIAHAAADGIDRMGCIMENQKQAKKRIDSYLDPYFTSHEPYKRAPQIPDGTMPERDFIDTWGPWKYDKNIYLPDGTHPPATKWDAYQKWFVGRVTPEADPSLWAIGLEEAMAGSRLRLLVMSDLFTVENQRSPTFRDEQLAKINGTIDSRLDDSGRLVILNHHVRRRGESNLVAMIDQYVGNARIVKQEGSYTKYANGVAVIRTPALEMNDEGIVVSYWPEKFPVDDYMLMPDGSRVEDLDQLSDEEHEELSAQGARRRRGLASRRERTPEAFDLLYQQNPDVVGFGDFTQDVLEGCFDYDRSFGEHRPDERLILGVDPARRGGAAWVLLGLTNDGVFSLVDFWLGDGLGFTGMREKLIREPVEQYRPRDLVWEINYEEETPAHPDAKEILRRFHVNFVPHRTHYNRSSGEFQVMAILDDMHDSNIRFPAKTLNDVMKLEPLLQHFRNFESVGYTERRHNRGVARLPDDGCLAFWFAWKHGHSWLSSIKGRAERATVAVSRAVSRAFEGMG